jgi:hypothetical protein
LYNVQDDQELFDPPRRRRRGDGLSTSHLPGSDFFSVCERSTKKPGPTWTRFSP